MKHFTTPHQINSKKQIKSWLLALLMVLFYTMPQLVTGQTIELLGAPPGGGPSGNVPSTSAQVTFYSTSATPAAPPLTATVTISNQQFSAVEGNNTTPGTLIGTTILASNNNDASANLVSGAPLYQLMNNVSGNTAATINPFYTNCATCPAGTGIDIASNYSLRLMNISDALINASGTNLQPLTARVQYSDMTITFSRPVNNPVIHFTGLGGFYTYNTTIPIGGTFTQYTQGFTTDIDLITPGFTWTKLSGNSVMNVTSTQISNTSTLFGSATLGGTAPDNITRTGASGSVAVNGRNITTFTMRMYLRGDGGRISDASGNVVSATHGNGVQWSSQQGHTPFGQAVVLNAFQGDGYLIGLSLLDCTPPKAVATPKTQTICKDGTASVYSAMPSTGVAYKWYGPLADTTSSLGIAISGQTAATYTPTGAALSTTGTKYYAVITNNTGDVACADTAFVILNITKPNAGADQNLTCTGANLPTTLQLIGTPSGGTWTDKSGNPTGATTDAAGLVTITNPTAQGKVFEFIYTKDGCKDTTQVTALNCNLCCIEQGYPTTVNQGFESTFTADINFPNATLSPSLNSKRYGVNISPIGTTGWRLLSAAGVKLVRDAGRATEGTDILYIEDAVSSTGSYCLENRLTLVDNPSCAAGTFVPNQRYVASYDYVIFNENSPAGGTGQAKPELDYTTPLIPNYIKIPAYVSGVPATATTAVDWANVATSWKRAAAVVTPTVDWTRLAISINNDADNATSGMLVDNVKFEMLKVLTSGIGVVSCNATQNARVFNLNPTNNSYGVPGLLYTVIAPIGYTLTTTLRSSKIEITCIEKRHN